MTQPIQIRVTLPGVTQLFVDWASDLPLVIGRQENDEPIGVVVEQGDITRLAIASSRRINLPRKQVRLDRIGDLIRIRNLKVGQPVAVDSQPVSPDEPDGRDYHLPFAIQIGDYQLVFENSYRTLEAKTQFFRTMPENTNPSFDTHVASDFDSGKLVTFLGQVSSVLQQSTTEVELYNQACRIVSQLIRVDGATILKGADWQQIYGDNFLSPSPWILERVRREQTVLWGIDQNSSKSGTNKSDVFFVAAPIVTMDGDREVVDSAIYAHRANKSTDTIEGSFKEIHGKLVELIACSVAAANVRIELQRTAGQFEQFFTPSLAKKLIQGNDLLEASEREITVLTCDIRGFSSISERLTPRDTSAWVQDVLSQLSESVLEFDGVLVDYIGDEVLAMWGAPETQPNHAELACFCAQRMISNMPRISQKWREKIGSETHIGIGVNSGMAFVGNTGTAQKFKYGPLGDTVNRANRVQGLTKYLKVDVLITGSTFAKVSGVINSRRIGKARVVNILEPIELFELLVDTKPEFPNSDIFEEAIRRLENGQLVGAADLIKNLLNFESPDHPTLLMLSEIISRVISGNSAGSYEWTFDKK